MRRISVPLSSLFLLALAASPSRAQGECGVPFTFEEIGEPCCVSCDGAIEHTLAGRLEIRERFTVVTLDLETPLAHLGAHVLVLGSKPAGLTLRGPDGECSLLPSPNHVFLLVEPAATADADPALPGRWSRSFAVPNVASMTGLVLYAQGVHLEAKGTAVGAVSNGLRVESL